MNLISYLYELLFNRKRKITVNTDPELFHSDDFLRPDHLNIRKCPKCNVEAITNKEATEIFGIRTFNGKPSIQSWCKKCRNKHDEFEASSKNNQKKIDI